MREQRRFTAVMLAEDYHRFQAAAHANWLSVSGFIRELFKSYEKEQAAKAEKEARAAARAAKAKARLFSDFSGWWRQTQSVSVRCWV